MYTATAARRIVSALPERITVLAAALESMSDAVAILDDEARLVYFNNAAGEMALSTGRQPEELLGRCVWQLWPGLVQMGAPDQFCAYSERIAPYSSRT